MDQLSDGPPPSPWQQGAERPWPAWVMRAIALVRRRVGPYATAVIFALIALPVVLFDVAVYAKEVTDYRDVRFPPTDPSVISASLLAVLLAAVIGSIVGVRFARRRAAMGWMVTVPVAWVTGIVALPIGPTLAGLPYASGRFCFDGCRASLVAPGIGIEPLRFDVWLFGLGISPLVQPLTFMTLVIGVGVWAWLVNQAARPAPDASPVDFAP